MGSRDRAKVRSCLCKDAATWMATMTTMTKWGWRPSAAALSPSPQPSQFPSCERLPAANVIKGVSFLGLQLSPWPLWRCFAICFKQMQPSKSLFIAPRESLAHPSPFSPSHLATWHLDMILRNLSSGIRFCLRILSLRQDRSSRGVSASVVNTHGIHILWALTPGNLQNQKAKRVNEKLSANIQCVSGV